MADEHYFNHCFELQSMLIYAKICRVYYQNQKNASFSVWYMSAKLGISLLPRVVKKVVKLKNFSILLPELIKRF